MSSYSSSRTHIRLKDGNISSQLPLALYEITFLVAYLSMPIHYIDNSMRSIPAWQEYILPINQ